MKPTFHDLLALWILEAARMRRQKLNVRDERNRSDFYDGFFEEKDFEASTLDPRSVIRRLTIAAFLSTQLAPGASVMDVGCGLGDVLAGLPANYRLYGLEYSAESVAGAQRRLGERAVIQPGSIHQIPLTSESLDACLCLEVLEHIADDAGAVAEMSRLLRVGGFLIAAVPYTYYWPQYRRLLGHYRHYNRDSFVHLFERNGLEAYAFLPNYPNWHQAYTRRYVGIRAQSMLFGRLFGEDSIYRFKWPWSRQPAIQKMEKKMAPLQLADAQLDYRRLPTSTFLVGRKKPA